MEDGEGLFLREAPSEILRDREVVMAAVKQNGRALEFADETLQEDKECLGKKKSSFIFSFINKRSGFSDIFCTTLVLRHVCYSQILFKRSERNSMVVLFGECALELLGEIDFFSRRIVLLALEEDAQSFRFASSKLHADRDVMLAAVRRNGLALQFAVEEFRDCPEILGCKWFRDSFVLKYSIPHFSSQPMLNW